VWGSKWPLGLLHKPLDYEKMGTLRPAAVPRSGKALVKPQEPEGRSHRDKTSHSKAGAAKKNTRRELHQLCGDGLARD
jgi:hypothetical protein